MLSHAPTTMEEARCSAIELWKYALMNVLAANLLGPTNGLGNSVNVKTKNTLTAAL